MSYEEKVKELKINLPEAKAPVGNYVATKVSGKMLFVSGQISIDESGQLIKGKIGKDLDTEAGYNAAKRCALSIIVLENKIYFSSNIASTSTETPKGKLFVLTAALVCIPASSKTEAIRSDAPFNTLG